MNDVIRRFEHHRPSEKLESPPIFRWPLKPVAIGLAFFAWYLLTPDYGRMATFEPGWIVQLWLRNAGLLLCVAGGLHWWLHIRRSQDKDYKYDSRWLAKNTRRFLFRDQVKDNMFWCFVSGVTFWTAYEAATLWAYASGTVASTTWGESPVYLSVLLVLVFFWSTLHFEFAHRPLQS